MFFAWWKWSWTPDGGGKGKEEEEEEEAGRRANSTGEEEACI